MATFISLQFIHARSRLRSLEPNGREKFPRVLHFLALLPLRRHHKVDAILIRLLRARPEPEPLQRTLPRHLAPGAQILGHRHAELGIVRRQLRERLVGIRRERDQRRAHERVGRRVHDGNVARPLVGDGQLGGEVHLLAGRKRLHVVLVVFELDALAEEEVAVWGAVAGDVLDGAGLVGLQGGDGGRAADLLRDRAGEADWWGDDVAVGEGRGGEEGGGEEGGWVHGEGLTRLRMEIGYLGQKFKEKKEMERVTSTGNECTDGESSMAWQVGGGAVFCYTDCYREVVLRPACKEAPRLKNECWEGR